MSLASVAAALLAAHSPRGERSVEATTSASTVDATLSPIFTVASLPAGIPGAAVTLQSPLLQPTNAGAGYGDELGASVVWLAEHRLGHAELQVTPDHLGPIEVRLQLDGARVHAEFYSAQPEVRQALEASLPRLRDMLGQNGLQLGHADVGQRQHNASPQAQTSAGDSEINAVSPAIASPLATRGRMVHGLLDAYA